MRLTVSSEFRFLQTPDGALWTTSVFGHSFWQRYLSVFSQVQVMARAHQVEKAPEGAIRVDLEGVVAMPLPAYQGPSEYLRRLGKIQRAVMRHLRASDAILMRIPSQIATSLWFPMSLQRRPYGVEVVGSAADALEAGAVQHPLRPLLRQWFIAHQKLQCRQAACAAYVTATTLQALYPPSQEAYCTHYSSIELGEEAFAKAPRDIAAMRFAGRRIRLINVASMEQPYKGLDILIDALYGALQAGLDLELVLVGDGVYRAQLEAQAARLQIADRVIFCGRLPGGEAVRRELVQADLFVLPSLTEGLPRAMIEAMALGIPCIGSDVGGIPELMDASERVPPRDRSALSKKIREILSDPERMAQLSVRNLRVARDYHERILSARRQRFYEELRERTARWLARRERR